MGKQEAVSGVKWSGVSMGADNIRCFFDNSETWGRVRKSGREHVEKYHDVRKEVKSLEKIYEDSLLE